MHASSTHTTAEGQSITMLGDTILVRPAEHSMISDGGIILTHDTHIYNTGVVLAFGEVTGKKSGRRAPIPDLKVGDHVAFIRYLDQQHTNLKIYEMFEGLIKISLSDVILVLDAEDVSKMFK